MTLASLGESLWHVASTEPWSFLIGALVGFLLSNRFRFSLSRRDRNGNGKDNGTTYERSRYR